MERREKNRFLRDLFGVSCAVTDTAVTLYGFDITIQLDSPSSRKLLWQCCGAGSIMVQMPLMESILMFCFVFTCFCFNAARHERVSCALVGLKPSDVDAATVNGNTHDGGPKKRRRIESNGIIAKTLPQTHHMLLDEVDYLASVFSNALD